MQESPAGRSIEEAIKAEAERLGFAFCGIASADPPDHRAEYRRWLADGFAGEMAYLHRHEPIKANPALLFEEARSLVTVGLNYAPPQSRPTVETGPIGVIARYARFDDYHETLLNRLSHLLSFMRRESPDCRGAAYCDTAPIAERDLAMRAGIGWIGKHTNLINRRFGNWFFIGTILTDLALAPDRPETPHCGTCTRCIPACPTGAIVAPYRLDARRCISYLTIELKSAIPVDLRPLVGNRIFGCDDCLAACPWNKFAVAASDPEVRPRADLEQPDLVELLELTQEGFRERFSHTPIARVKRRGLARNVCVALGNVGDIAALPALTRSRDHDPDILVREHARWAIEQIAERVETANGRSGTAGS